MTSDWYDVSLSTHGDSEWDEPVSILALSFIRAAEERLKDEAMRCDDWLESDWEAHVTCGEREWYVTLKRPQRYVRTEGCQYWPIREADES